MQPQPLHARHVRQSLDQLRQYSFVVKVLSVVGQVLRDELKLAYPFFGQQSSLLHDLLHRTRAVTPCDDRYRAVGTFTVAPLSDF